MYEFIPAIGGFITIILLFIILLKTIWFFITKGKISFKERWRMYRKSFPVIDTGVYSNAIIADNLTRYSHHQDAAEKIRNDDEILKENDREINEAIDRELENH